MGFSEGSIVYILSKPFISLDKYHIYNIESINIGLIFTLIIIYLLIFAIFPFPAMRKIVFTSYLAVTGYPKLLKDKENNKTYYLAYEKRGKLYVYDINKSLSKCEKDLNTDSSDKNNDLSYSCFGKVCIESFFPNKQHIIYDIKDKNISIFPFNEDKLFKKDCNKTKEDKNNEL